MFYRGLPEALKLEYPPDGGYYKIPQWYTDNNTGKPRPQWQPDVVPTKPAPTKPLLGWLCPKCGAGVSPYADKCKCA